MVPINDITTDPDDPPPFVDVLPLRRRAWTSAAYPGPEAAALQRATWPDITPLVLARPRPAVHVAVRAAMERRGWAIVGDDPAEGRLEAIATTRWLRFKDDIVVRLRDLPGDRTRVDVRSKSRIGRSDLGTNARRIRELLRTLAA